jgi:hypothetical protein
MLPSLARVAVASAAQHRSSSASKRRDSPTLPASAELPALPQSPAAKKIGRVYEAYGISSTPVSRSGSVKRAVSAVKLDPLGAQAPIPVSQAPPSPTAKSPSQAMPAAGSGAQPVRVVPDLVQMDARQERFTPLFDTIGSPKDLVASIPELRIEQEVAVSTKLRPVPPLPAVAQYEKPMDSALAIEEQRHALLPARSEFGPIWQVVLPMPRGFPEGDEGDEAPDAAPAVRVSSMRFTCSSYANPVVQFAELGFVLTIDVNDVETLLLLLESHNSATFKHAAALLSRWLSRGDSILLCLFRLCGHVV